MFEVVETGFREGRQIALVAEPSLAFGEFGDDGVGLGFDACIAGRSVHLATGGKKMADVVAAPAVGGRFAIVERRGGRGQAGVEAEVMEQAVEIESQHIVKRLLAHAKQIGIENGDVFKGEGKGGGRWARG